VMIYHKQKEDMQRSNLIVVRRALYISTFSIKMTFIFLSLLNPLVSIFDLLYLSSFVHCCGSALF
jgi:hypothetical protein